MLGTVAHLLALAPWVRIRSCSANLQHLRSKCVNTLLLYMRQHSLLAHGNEGISCNWRCRAGRRDACRRGRRADDGRVQGVGGGRDGDGLDWRRGDADAVWHIPSDVFVSTAGCLVCPDTEPCQNWRNVTASGVQSKLPSLENRALESTQHCTTPQAPNILKLTLLNPIFHPNPTRNSIQIQLAFVSRQVTLTVSAGGAVRCDWAVDARGAMPAPLPDGLSPCALLLHPLASRH